MRRLRKQQRFELTIRQFIRGVPKAMYDIGVGPKTEWQTLGDCFPSMQIFGCEPHPETRANIVSRGFTGTLWPVAIGTSPGSATLHEPPANIGGSSLFPLTDAIRTFVVPVWTLDQFDEAAGSPEQILMWMDIEGSELSALRSGRGLMTSGRVRWINLEERLSESVPTSGWTKPSELHQQLVEFGYTRVCDYKRHSTHQDAIYVHASESAD